MSEIYSTDGLGNYAFALAPEESLLVGGCD